VPTEVESKEAEKEVIHREAQSNSTMIFMKRVSKKPIKSLLKIE
jgi:hypothetical protein